MELAHSRQGALAYSEDSRWRNRAEFIHGREQIVAFLSRKWQKEQEYRLIKELWAFTDHRIAVRFAYEWKDDSGNWYRSHGNENRGFAASGLMKCRYASINDLRTIQEQRLFRWPQDQDRKSIGLKRTRSVKDG